MQNIIYLDPKEIENHPDNPRKNIGDVTELSESIKRDGIRQNLTVIPYEQGYRCLIGHRRLAAAKLAGLERVPCIVEKDTLTRNEQIAIMLAENMQRADLTPIEEAASMQLMLDLGDTVDSVSEKTGLSKSTVYRRINPIREYGQEKVMKAFERGATFSDFEKLASITDPEKRAAVAEVIGTNNFDYKYTEACRADENEKKKAELIKLLNSFAMEITAEERRRLNLKYSHCTPPWNENYKKPSDTETVKYFYCIDTYSIEIYREPTPEELEKSKQLAREHEKYEEDRQKQNEAKAQLSEITETASRLRREFIIRCNPLSGCSSKQAQLDIYKQMCDFFVRAYVNFALSGNIASFDVFAGNIGMKMPDDFENMDRKMQSGAVSEHLKKNKSSDIRSMLAILTAILEPYCDMKYYDCQARYQPCEQLDFIYEVLCAFGYEMSDTEKQMQNGTHKLFMRGDK